jgi:hypothetical protein
MPRPWTVLEHSPIEKLQPNLWTVEAALPRGPLRRRMGIARFSDGRLLFLNAIALDEPSMKQIEAWGEPAFALAGNGFHKIDLGSYKARYPKLRVLAGAGARKSVAPIAPVDGFLELLPQDAGVRVEEAAGNKMGEVTAICTSGGEATLCVPGDLLANAAGAPGFAGIVLQLAGISGDLKVPRVFKLMGLRDKRALREHLVKLSETPGLRRVFACHGSVISADAAGALRRAAQALS